METTEETHDTYVSVFLSPSTRLSVTLEPFGALVYIGGVRFDISRSADAERIADLFLRAAALLDESVSC